MNRKKLSLILVILMTALCLPLQAAADDGIVTSVSLTVQEPVAGMSFSSLSWQFSSDAGDVDAENAIIKWYLLNELGGWDRVDTDSLAEAGEIYSFDCTLKMPEGFTVSEDVTGFVNGQPSGTEYGEVYAGPDAVYLAHSFEAVEGFVREKSKVRVVRITVDEPEAGKTPEDIAVSVSSVPDGGVKEDETVTVWYRCEKNSADPSDWQEMGPDETFENGMFYSPDFFVSPADGYEFSEELEGWVNGEKSDETFNPLYTTKRQAYLCKCFGPVGGAPFTDVTEDDYYFDAVTWAFSNRPRITDGTSKTTFSPERTCTRGQVVTFLWRAAGEPEPGASENPFADVKESDYFFKPVLWAVEKGITDGTAPDAFSPDTDCRNSHILTFIYRAMGEPGKTEEPEVWYSDALRWAEDEALLEGTFEGEFDVNGLCPRCSVVEYLYRYSLAE